MTGRRALLALWLALATAVAWASEPLTLIHTADVRGTVGICG